MNTTRFRIAHISDLHFAEPTLSPLQFFSKRWVGNLYQMFSRSKYLDSSQLEKLVDQFIALKIDYVFITGDLTTTSRIQELRHAADFAAKLQSQGLRVIAIPGNHDHYTRKACRQKLFYRFFPDYRENGFSLKDDGLALIPLHEGWTLLALDTACATSLFSSQGNFHSKIESSLKSALLKIPARQNVILMNHFPLFEHEKPNKTLLRATALRTLVASHPNIRFYLHGHTHTHCLADLRASRYPIILDSGSTSQITAGSWNMLDLASSEATVHVYRSSHSSAPAEQTSFSWE